MSDDMFSSPLGHVPVVVSRGLWGIFPKRVSLLKNTKYRSTVIASQQFQHPPLIHVSSANLWSDCSSSRLSSIFQSSLSPATLSSSFRVAPKARNNIIPPASFGCSPWSPSSWLCLEIPQRESPRTHHMPKPPWLVPFQLKGALF